MAIFTPGPLVSSVSGKIGGQIFSHNAGGKYIRSNAIPTNPNTTEQALIRAINAQSAADYQALTQTQRDAWISWAASAAAAEYTNALGMTQQLSGQQAYMRFNNTLAYAGIATIDDPPVGVNPPNSPISVSFVFDINTTNTAITVDPTAPGVGFRHQAAMTLPQSPGVSSFRRNMLRLITTSATGTALDAATNQTNYQARYGVPTEDMLLGMAVRALNEDTGMVSPWVFSPLTAVTT